MYVLRRLLWVDCLAGALVGVAVLSLSGWLSDLHGLPRGLLLVTGAANLAYASYSFSLAVRARRPRRLIVLLVVANLTWAVVCLGLAAAFSASATGFGLAHLVAEAVVVGGLAVLEWSQRDRLLAAA